MAWKCKECGKHSGACYVSLHSSNKIEVAMADWICSQCGEWHSDHASQKPTPGLGWELSDKAKHEIAEIERNAREAHRLASSTYFD